MQQRWKGYGPGSVVPGVGVSEPGTPREPRAATLTYEAHYGLRTKPFSLSTDPRGLYRSASHAPVLEELLAGIRRRDGIVVLTGEMGMGKTTLCRSALYQLDRKTLTTFVPDPALSREDLLRMLLVGFGEVTVEELKQGRLHGAPRADLGCQLYEFLTSLESVDAFAVLVIDEAQRLPAPLLDEVRALSEMEAGRKLLQIVLVGQPELRSRLKEPEMRQIAQRVTTRCELQGLTREGVTGYVQHRLRLAGADRDRVEFSQAALDALYDASGGVPRLVNRVCDRALSYGFLDRTSLIGPAQVSRAVGDLELSDARASRGATGPEVRVEPTPAVRARPGEQGPADIAGGLFARKGTTVSSGQGSDLHALLDLAPMAPRPRVEAPPPAARPRAPRRKRGMASLFERLAHVKSAALPLLGAGVVLIGGGLAVAAGGRSPEPGGEPATRDRSELAPRAVEAQALLAPSAPVVPVASADAVAPEAPIVRTWSVQAGAFSSAARATAMAARLADAGFPAYVELGDFGARGALSAVRVGPFTDAGEADQVRDALRARSDASGAFVRETVGPSTESASAARVRMGR